MSNEIPRHRRGSLVGPAILIGLGVVLLLNNLGMLPWSVWGTILRLWPVLIIAGGLDLLIGRRSLWGSLLVVLLLALVVAGLLWLLGSGVGGAAGSEEIAQPLGNANRARVEIAPSVADLHLAAFAGSSSDLLAGTVNLARGETVSQDAEFEDGAVRFVLRSSGVFASFGGGAETAWELQINRDVPLDLEVALGVGDARLDLTGLQVDELQANMAIGQTTVTLPQEGRFEAQVHGAIGQIVVVVPQGMAVRVHLGTALAGRQLPPDYRCEEDVCTSPGYISADNRVDLDLGLAIGSVVVRHP